MTGQWTWGCKEKGGSKETSQDLKFVLVSRKISLASRIEDIRRQLDILVGSVDAENHSCCWAVVAFCPSLFDQILVGKLGKQGVGGGGKQVGGSVTVDGRYYVSIMVTPP